MAEPSARSTMAPARPASPAPRAPAPIKPAPAPRPTDRRGPERSGPRMSTLALIAWVALLVTISAVGARYYGLPMAARVRHPLHAWLRPSGYVGQTAGILSLAIFGFLWLYPLRKRYRWLSFTGAIAKWLNVHVLAALALPLLVAIHAAWHFGGVIGLGFWSMMVVWTSGIIGRYIYARIPRGRAGVELTIEEIAAERKALLEQIGAQTGLDPATVEATLAPNTATPAGLGLWGTLRHMAADDLTRRRAIRRLRHLCERAGPGKRRADRTTVSRVLGLARREMALTQQARMLDATHDLFRYWHVAHRPVAIAALIAVLVHVGVVVALGATWFR